MSYRGRVKLRLVAGGVLAAATAGTMLFGAAGPALAEPGEPVPPNCTAADLAQLSSRVAAQTSDYLFAHPDVNDFFTSQKGKTSDELRDDLDNYMNAHPQVHSDLTGIRQPLTDHRDRCQDPE